MGDRFTGILVCGSFLISVCLFIVSKALLISSVTMIVRAGGTIWLNPFTTLLSNVCSAVIVECVPVWCECAWYVFCYVKKKTLLQFLCNY